MDLLRRCGHTCLKLGRWEEAVNDMSKVLEEKRGDAELWRDRATAYAEMRRWPQSASDYGQVHRLKPDEFAASYLLALTSLAAGNPASYHDFCRNLLNQYGDTRDPGAADTVAFLAALHPYAVPDSGRLVRLAQFAHDSKPDNAAYLETLGAALYRAGRYSEAVDRLKEAVDKKGDNGTFWTCFFLAMSHHQLEQRLSGVRAAGLMAGPVEGFGSVRALGPVLQPDWQGKKWFDAGVRNLEEAKDASWVDKLRWRLLRDEAAGLLGVNPDTPAKSTPMPGVPQAP